MGVFLSCKSEGEKFLNDAEKEKQEGIQGQWQQESPAKEFLDQVKSSADTDCTPKMTRYAHYALKRTEIGRKTKNISRLK